MGSSLKGWLDWVGLYGRRLCGAVAAPVDIAEFFTAS
jgi:hypothetical protein